MKVRVNDNLEPIFDDYDIDLYDQDLNQVDEEIEIKGTDVYWLNNYYLHLMCLVVKDLDISWGIMQYDQDLKVYKVVKEVLKSDLNIADYKLEVCNENTYITDIYSIGDYSEYLEPRYKFLINQGSSRSSKTLSLIDLMDLWADSHNNQRISIWRETKTNCKKTVMHDMIKRLRSTDRFYNRIRHDKTNSIFEYLNYSTINFLGADDEETVHGYEQDIAWLNEPYKVSLYTFNQIAQRTSRAVFVDWNPKKDSFIDEVAKRERAIVIYSDFTMNYFCPPNQRDNILAYQPVSRCRLVEDKELAEVDALNYDLASNPNKYQEDDLQELKRCISNKLQGSASPYHWSVYGKGEKGEREHRIFRWKKCTYTEYINLPFTEWFGVDWGKVDAWGIVGVKYDNVNNKLYINELNYRSEDDTWKLLSDADKRIIKGQTSEFDKENNGIVSWMFQRLNIPKNAMIVCDNNRESKIIQLRNYGWVKAFKASKPAGSIIDGIELLDYKIDVYYTETSKNIEAEQNDYSWKTDKYGNVLEEPEDDNNHTIDPTRYVVSAMQQFGVIKII